MVKDLVRAVCSDCDNFFARTHQKDPVSKFRAGLVRGWAVWYAAYGRPGFRGKIAPSGQAARLF